MMLIKLLDITRADPRSAGQRLPKVSDPETPPADDTPESVPDFAAMFTGAVSSM